MYFAPVNIYIRTDYIPGADVGTHTFGASVSKYFVVYRIHTVHRKDYISLFALLVPYFLLP